MKGRRLRHARWYRVLIAALVFGLFGALPVAAAPPANGQLNTWGDDSFG